MSGARYVTPLLWVDGWLPFPHEETASVDGAVEYVLSEIPVVVPDMDTAAAVLRKLGVDDGWVAHQTTFSMAGEFDGAL